MLSHRKKWGSQHQRFWECVRNRSHSQGPLPKSDPGGRIPNIYAQIQTREVVLHGATLSWSCDCQFRRFASTSGIRQANPSGHSTVKLVTRPKGCKVAEFKPPGKASKESPSHPYRKPTGGGRDGAQPSVRREGSRCEESFKCDL
jgi:hypothetical protein